LNTTSISNTGNISTNTLFTTTALVSSLSIFDPITVSTGNFRYSTLTTLFALPNISLLYFNNLVIGGAYVWPGQTISALDWSGIWNETEVGFTGVGNIFIPVNNSGFSRTIFSNVTGGTPPYSVLMSPTDILTTRMGFGTTGVVLYTSTSTTAVTGLGPSNVTFTLIDSSTPRFQRSFNFVWKTANSAG